jgi:ribosome-binding factor A
MERKRLSQVESYIKQHVSNMIATREISDPRIWDLVITKVKVTRDIQNAKLYYFISGSQEAKKTVQKVLKNASGYIRHNLAQSLTTRYTPELVFYFDEALEHGNKMHSLLEKVSKELKSSSS